MIDDDTLLKIKRAHSQMHEVDRGCTAALQVLVRMQKTCYAHGLTDQLNDVHSALKVLHAAAEAKWEKGE